MLFLSSALMFLVSGSKIGVISVVFAVAATNTLSRRRLNPRVLGIGLVVTAFVFVFVNQYRTEIRYGGASITESATTNLERLASGSGPFRTAISGITSVLLRAENLEEVAVTLRLSPSRFAYKSLADAPAEVGALLIPRSLWPNKPIVDDGHDFAVDFLGYPEWLPTSAAVTLVGGTYQYGGWAATVAVGMAIGAALAALDSSFNPLQRPASILMVIGVGPYIAMAEDGLVVSIATAIRLALVTAALGWFALARRADVKGRGVLAYRAPLP